jgi:tripartite-type tricarboxylate transporter receptor subunit TctC
LLQARSQFLRLRTWHGRRLIRHGLRASLLGLLRAARTTYSLASSVIGCPISSGSHTSSKIAQALPAAEAAVRAQADGYTLHLASTPDTVNTTLYEKITFSYIRDMAPVASIIRTPLVMVANPLVPVGTVSEFIAYARANSRTLNMASAGIGTPPHIAGELFKLMTGVNMLHVPYRGGAPAVADMVGGQMQIMFAVMPDCIEQVRAGKLRALAVTTATPSEALPGIPTVADFLPGYESSFWIGITAPKNTPVDVVEKLNNEINRALVDPAIKARITDLGASVLSGSRADFGRLIADETEKWGKLIRAANIKVE